MLGHTQGNGQRCNFAGRRLPGPFSFLKICIKIFAELRARRLRLREGQGRLMAPQVLLCFYDQLAPNAVALMAELVPIPEAVQMLQRDQSTLDSLQRWANSDTPTAQLALRILQMIGTNGEQQQYRMGDCNGQLGKQHTNTLILTFLIHMQSISTNNNIRSNANNKRTSIHIHNNLTTEKSFPLL